MRWWVDIPYRPPNYIVSATNNCHVRVWLHTNNNNTGYSACMSPRHHYTADDTIRYVNVYVSTNTADCPVLTNRSPSVLPRMQGAVMIIKGQHYGEPGDGALRGRNCEARRCSGLTVQERARREQIRLMAAEHVCFAVQVVDRFAGLPELREGLPGPGRHPCLGGTVAMGPGSDDASGATASCSA